MSLTKLYDAPEEIVERFSVGAYPFAGGLEVGKKFGAVGGMVRAFASGVASVVEIAREAFAQRVIDFFRGGSVAVEFEAEVREAGLSESFMNDFEGRKFFSDEEN